MNCAAPSLPPRIWEDILPGAGEVDPSTPWQWQWGLALWIPPAYLDAWDFSCAKFAQHGLLSVLVHFGMWCDFRANQEGRNETERLELRALQSRTVELHARLLRMQEPAADPEPTAAAATLSPPSVLH